MNCKSNSINKGVITIVTLLFCMLSCISLSITSYANSVTIHEGKYPKGSIVYTTEKIDITHDLVFYIPKGTAVEFLGESDGQAVIKYEHRTYLCGYDCISVYKPSGNSGIDGLEILRTVVVILAIGIILLVIFYRIKKAYDNKQKQQILEQTIFDDGEMYNAVKALNETYSSVYYKKPERTKLNVSLNSKAQYDRFNPDKYLVASIIEGDVTKEDIAAIIAYEEKGDRYQREVDGILEKWEKSPNPKITDEEFTEHDKNAAMDEAFHWSKGFRIYWSYTSPKGNASYNDHKKYLTAQLNDALAEAERVIDSRNSAAYQRSLMTPKLRYEVLKRDHYHCVICGRGEEDGVKLHVDHIIPVAKGGKTEKSNLRVLCQDCNLGKHDDYDEEYDYAK